MRSGVVLAAILLVAFRGHSQSKEYPWLSHPVSSSILQRVGVPAGYQRVETQPGTFALWLRNLPVKEGKPDVMLFDGSKKFNQHAQYLVLDIDTGTKDLQQCADAVMRLQAEYLYANHLYEQIAFHFTNGFLCDFQTWAKGFRPAISGNVVSWKKTASPDSGYRSFRNYMNTIFSYCGTASLSKELASRDVRDIQPGDVFIRGGFPGHAVIVVDVAIHAKTGERLFLLVQSYMPAQDMHVLVNPGDNKISPWYSTAFGEELHTPEWTFSKTELKKF